MKAEELMRNDWVCIVNENAPKQVDWIRSGEVGLLWSQTVTPPYLKPIPLTPEILEKNGWETEYFGRRQEWWLDKTKFPIVRYSANDALQHNGIVLKYVHQLQHALRLLGIEKEIKL